MKKKLLGIILTVAMVICLMPLSVSAGTSGLYIANGDDSSIYIGGDATGSLGGGTYSYDYDNAVLTLDSVEISIGDMTDTGILFFSGDKDKVLTIILKNTNVITSDREDADGVFTDRNLIIKSEDGGELIIKSNANKNIKGGIYAKTVTFSGLVNVDITATDSAVYGLTDIYFDLAKGGKVHGVISSKEDKDASMCAHCVSTIEVPDTHTILADGTKGYADKELLESEQYAWYIYNAEGKHAKDVTVYVAADEAKPAGANTGDSNEVALFAIMGILALAGAGFVGYKKREN